MPEKSPSPCGARPVDSHAFPYIRCGLPVEHKGRHKGAARLGDGPGRQRLDVEVRWGSRTYGMHCSGCEGHCDGEGVA